MHLFESKCYGGIHFDPRHHRITTRSLQGCMGTPTLHFQSVVGKSDLSVCEISEYLQLLFYEVSLNKIVRSDPSNLQKSTFFPNIFL